MATYLLVNILFMAVVLLLLRAKLRRPTKQWLVVLIILFVMTAVFDSIIVGLSIVSYDPSKILGIFVGFAPIEDFFYALFACLVVPLVWNGVKPKDKKAL